MNMRNMLSTSVLIPMQKSWSGRRYFKAKQLQREMERHQLDRSVIDDVRNRKFLQLIAHCHANVDFYRRVFEERNLSPRSFQSLDDLRQLPILEKEVMTAGLRSLTANNYTPAQVRYLATGGTTGTPTKFGMDRINAPHSDAKDWFLWNMGGYRLGMKTALFWGNELELSHAHTFYSRVKRFAENTMMLNFYRLSDEALRAYAKSLDSYRPDIVRGFGSAIHHYVRVCSGNNWKAGYEPSGVIITSDKIYDREKAAISSYFNAPVFEEYGSREFSLIAHECAVHNGLHCADESLVCEVIDKRGNILQEGRGEIVITSLINYSVPMIRYRLGDEVTLSRKQCACGRKLTLISSIDGRIGDFVLTKTGNLVYGDFFAHLFYNSSGVKQYQIRQVKRGEAEILIVINDAYREQEIQAIVGELQSMHGNDLTATISIVPAIPASPSGKRRTVVSDLYAR